MPFDAKDQVVLDVYFNCPPDQTIEVAASTQCNLLIITDYINKYTLRKEGSVFLMSPCFNFSCSNDVREAPFRSDDRTSRCKNL